MKKSKKETERDIQQISKLQAEALLKIPAYKKALAKYEALSIGGEKRKKIAEEKHKLMKLLHGKPRTIPPSSKYFKHTQRWKKIDEDEKNLEEQRKAISREICSKFSLPFPYTLRELKYIAEGGGFFLGELNKIVDIIQLREPEHKFVPRKQVTKKDLEGKGRSTYHGQFIAETIDDGYLDEEGFLHFKIKAGTPRETIFHLLNALLNIYEPKKSKKRFRAGYINPFEVHYKETVEGKNLLQIAKELSGIHTRGEKPAINTELNAMYEQVKRASKLAKEILSTKYPHT